MTNSKHEASFHIFALKVSKLKNMNTNIRQSNVLWTTKDVI